MNGWKLQISMVAWISISRFWLVHQTHEGSSVLWKISSFCCYGVFSERHSICMKIRAKTPWLHGFFSWRPKFAFSQFSQEIWIKIAWWSRCPNGPTLEVLSLALAQPEHVVVYLRVRSWNRKNLVDADEKCIVTQLAVSTTGISGYSIEISSMFNVRR